MESFRNKELKKLEKTDKIKVGPSIEFKKKNLDYYLQILEEGKNQYQLSDKIQASKRKQRNYGKWYLQTRDFQKTLDE